MVFIRETDTLLFGFSDLLVTWKQENGKDWLEEIKIPRPLLPENLTEGQIKVIKKEKRTITCLELSKKGQYIAITTENKQLVVFDQSFKPLKNILLSRVSNKVCFTPTNDILVADRTGDVFLYKMDDEKNEPTLLLGHLSVILDMIITDCGKYIITCDRDEKIRVSHFPNAYNIASFCLGHTEFVTNLKLLKDNNVLLSASGDGTIRMWHYLQGKEVNKIDTRDLAEEKILVDFSSQMDAEKVDVTNLPITDMQIHQDGEDIRIVVSLYNMAHLHFYKMNSKTLQYAYVTKINNGTKLFSFYLPSSSNKCYNFNSSGNMAVYQFVNSGISYLSGCFLKEYLIKYKELFTFDSDITLWYKRKFDNVQEYLERKRQRIESK